MASDIAFHGLLALGGCGSFLFVSNWAARHAPPAGYSAVREGIAALIVVFSALASTAPLLRPVQFGGSDAYHYAIPAADFDPQVRAGVYLVLVGQSIYGFNGNIHTLRTAPYHVHLHGDFDSPASWPRFQNSSKCPL